MRFESIRISPGHELSNDYAANLQLGQLVRAAYGLHASVDAEYRHKVGDFDELIFFAEEDERAVGSLVLNDLGQGNYYVHGFAVLPEQQGKGIGKSMFSRMKEQVGEIRGLAGVVNNPISVTARLANFPNMATWWARQPLNEPANSLAYPSDTEVRLLKILGIEDAPILSVPPKYLKRAEQALNLKNDGMVKQISAQLVDHQTNNFGLTSAGLLISQLH